HCSPKLNSSAPTTSRSVLIGSCVSAGPNVATNAASVAVAAAQPYSEEDQLRVLPTASTIVRASMASTAHARKTETTSASSGPDTTPVCPDRRGAPIGARVIVPSAGL